jgi:hypothetical protein
MGDREGREERGEKEEGEGEGMGWEEKSMETGLTRYLGRKGEERAGREEGGEERRTGF